MSARFAQDKDPFAVQRVNNFRHYKNSCKFFAFLATYLKRSSSVQFQSFSSKMPSIHVEIESSKRGHFILLLQVYTLADRKVDCRRNLAKEQCSRRRI